jgi:hypothetical protein
MFYSTVLAGLAQAQTHSRRSILNLILFAANIFLVGYLVYAYSASPCRGHASALMLLADTLFELHTWVMSEPLFIILT